MFTPDRCRWCLVSVVALLSLVGAGAQTLPAGVPTLVLPNGLLLPGYKNADELLKRIRQESLANR